jgi:hypothetical protein
MDWYRYELVRYCLLALENPPAKTPIPYELKKETSMDSTTSHLLTMIIPGFGTTYGCSSIGLLYSFQQAVSATQSCSLR